LIPYFLQFTVDGADGRTGVRAAPRVVSASGEGTGVATHPGRLKMGITVTATTSTMTHALAPTVRVNSKGHALVFGIYNDMNKRK